MKKIFSVLIIFAMLFSSMSGSMLYVEADTINSMDSVAICSIEYTPRMVEDTFHYLNDIYIDKWNQCVFKRKCETIAYI